MHRMLKIITSALLLMLLQIGWQSSAHAQTIKVIAVVDGEAITNYDLDNRLTYLLATTGIKMTAENENQLRDDVLQMLIDDKVKLKEGKRLSPAAVSASRSQAIELVNQAYGSKTKTANQRLKELQIERQTVEDKYLADVVWASLVREKFKSQFDNVGKLAEQSLERLKRDLSQPQIRISEIVLAPTPDRPTAQNLDIAKQMVQAIQEGADFSAIARQYSAAGSASNGGRLNWMVQSSLPDIFQKQLALAESGETIAPLNVDGIIYILRKDGVRAKGLIDPSQTKVTIARALSPLSADVDEAERLIAAGTMQKATASLNSCEAMDQLNKELASGQPSYLRNLELGTITPALREIIEKLEIGQPSEPLLFSEGIVSFMVCERIAPALNLPPIEELERDELNKLFSILSNRYLLRLRRSTTIEMR